VQGNAKRQALDVRRRSPRSRGATSIDKASRDVPSPLSDGEQAQQAQFETPENSDIEQWRMRIFSGCADLRVTHSDRCATVRGRGFMASLERLRNHALYSNIPILTTNRAIAPAIFFTIRRLMVV
jgi:hypothetical protein